jgi:hypothetical protein
MQQMQMHAARRASSELRVCMALYVILHDASTCSLGRVLLAGRQACAALRTSPLERGGALFLLFTARLAATPQCR